MSEEKPFQPALQGIEEILERAGRGDRLALAQLYGLLGMRVSNSDIPVAEKNWLAIRLKEMHSALMSAAIAEKDPPHFNAIIARAAGVQRSGKGNKASRVREMRRYRADLSKSKPGIKKSN